MPAKNRGKPEDDDPSSAGSYDPGYEVDENEPPVQKAKIVRARIDDSDEDPKPIKRKKIVAAIADDDDDSERRDEEPTKKKKKKSQKRIKFEDDTNSHSDLWWILPTCLIVVGLIMCVAGVTGFNASLKADKQSIPFVIGFVIGQLIAFMILSVIGLFVGGMLMGIEYGTPLTFAINIAAIAAMILGLEWMVRWIIGDFWQLINLINSVAAVSMFMTLFKLDLWEVCVSLFSIKVINFLLSIAFLAFVFAAANKEERELERKEKIQWKQGNNRFDGD
jgi:hypothetical protein